MLVVEHSQIPIRIPDLMPSVKARQKTIWGNLHMTMTFSAQCEYCERLNCEYKQPAMLEEIFMDLVADARTTEQSNKYPVEILGLPK